ncbi:MAG: hypothetical protein IKO73_01985 [Bacteroidaceae bacterium]|nr:hypothetical protein [Bacteroidaceae bacterium]
MTNRLSKWRRQSSRMICLMAACGLMYACKDEFLLDDQKPGWLNTSIYESLQKSGNFTTYLRLLGDSSIYYMGEKKDPELGWPLEKMLRKTGSKTVFVADDDAWKAFFEKNKTLPEGNPWHNATCYENLSVAQKRLMIHTSMLNNAIVMENLASSEASGDNSPVRGEYMRRFTDVKATDTVTHIAPEDLPYTYSPVDKDYWEKFRENGKGIYLVTDSSLSMMLHFTQEHMSRNNIDSDIDFPKFMGRERITSDVHIYDAHLDSTDIVCQNGYVNLTEKPLCPLPSMAEVIRTNGRTKIFSHILDRYSAPFYNRSLTINYQVLHPEFTDSIYTKRYFSDNSAGGNALNYEQGNGDYYVRYYPWKYNPIPESLKDYAGAGDVSLKYDPAWNEYYEDPQHPENREKDMAAMFVPNDSTMWDYFTRSGGMQLIKTYYVREGTEYEIPYTTPAEGDYDALYRQIDCIPLTHLQRIINLIMRTSFVASVPTKMTKQKDDAMEQLFYPEDIDMIETCSLASNGAVYIMKQMYGPADFTAVTAPAFISTTNKIMNWAIYDKDNMGLNYYAYLKAMQSRFTFFMPSDAGLKFYYDPTSMKSRTPRCIELSHKPGQSSQVQVTGKCYNYYSPYNQKDGPIGTKGKALQGSNANITSEDIINRLKDVLESHTIVHDGTNPIDGEDEYFLSKNGNAIKVVRDADNNIIAAKGGFQIENERQGVVSDSTLFKGIKRCEVTAPFPNLKNGSTYVLDSPLVPTYRSVWSIFTNDMQDTQYSPNGTEATNPDEWENNPYRAFYELCAETNDTLIRGCGLVNDNLGINDKNAAMKKFIVFTNDFGLDYNIQFFNNYRYTIFVPTNEAIQKAIDNGLPTWELIRQDYRAHCKHELDPVTGEWAKDTDGNYTYSDSLETYEDSVRIAAKITYLTNFIRYHFADNSVFADKSEITDADGEMVTSSYDHETGLFCKIHIDRIKQGDGAILRVCDDVTFKNDKSNKMPTVGEKNVLARDISCSSSKDKKAKSPRGQAMADIILDASSAAVIHQIDGVLNHTALVNGRHDSTWNTTADARRYLKRYAIVANK